MPTDNRDRQLEKALARHLRGESHDASCPDAELLAAYHERTLSLEEMSQWKEHIVGCSRCQEILALVEESNAVQREEWEEGKMPALVTGMAVSAAALGLPQATPVKKPIHPRAWRWVVPVGALAAGLLVWVAVRENQRSLATKTEPIQVAENREATGQASAPPVSSEAENSRRRDEVSTLHSEIPADAGRTRLPEPAKQALPLEKKATRQLATPVLTPPPTGEFAKDKTPPLDQLSAGMPEPPAAPISQAYSYSSSDVKAMPAAPPVAARAAAPVAAAPAAGPAKQAALAGGLGGQQNQKTKLQSQVSETVEVSSAGVESQSLNDVLPQAGIIIVAPVDAYAWRIGTGGKIEHSTDGSRSWSLQKSGVTSDLTAGSASSGKVCWVVGKAGTVLLTTDGGRHWKQLASPTREDLAGVDAMDGKRASIWIASHSKSFETNDGGATWTPVVNK